MLTQPMMLRPPESRAKRPRRADLSVIAAVTVLLVASLLGASCNTSSPASEP